MKNIKSESVAEINGKQVILYSITNNSGAKVELLNLGATIHSIIVPNKTGELLDVTLGFKDYRSYLNDGAALGKSVGRYANRIAKGLFSLDGVEYQLAINNGVNHLHGGPTGYMNRIWNSETDGENVIFSYTSADGEEGYPSMLIIQAIYNWSDDNTLTITYKATTDGATIINLTNHTYFNLNGEGSGDIHSHELKLNASRYLPTDETLIPTGELKSVSNSPMDFTSLKSIGKDIAKEFEPLKIGVGYDHCWVIDNVQSGELTQAALLKSENSGITLEISTTQPGVQVYTGNWLTGAGVAKCGKDHVNRDGVAIECQNFPDAPNKPEFPSPILRKGDEYCEKIVFKFSTK